MAVCTAIGQNGNSKKKTMYVLLDRNSKNIDFRVSAKKDGSDPLILYTLDTNIKNDFIYKITFANAHAPILDRIDEEKKIPISFLNSISYMDEKKIQETDYIHLNKFHWEKLQKTRVYLIDMGTLHNDSVTMYEVSVGFTGFLE